MDTARWKHGDEFQVLDLIARFEFKSPSSLSFGLGVLVGRDSPRLPEMDELTEEQRGFLVGPGPVYLMIGWLDAHHPCDGLHRLQLRVGLPDRYVCWESMRDLVPQVLNALGLPADESYKVHLSGMSQLT